MLRGPAAKQFIPNSLGARHKDVMLYAKMWAMEIHQQVQEAA